MRKTAALIFILFLVAVVASAQGFDVLTDAERWYLKVLEKDPKNVEAMLAVGNCYANRGQNGKALEWYAKVELDKISDPVVLYNIGTNYYNNSKFEDAFKFYKKAVELKADFTDAIYQLGLTYLTTGQTSRRRE